MTAERSRGSGGFARPRKRFGQHFLTDRRVLARIADALGPDSTSCVVEIGPGRGALTEVLTERSGELIAIEIDRDLAAYLRSRYAGNPRVRVIAGDALEQDWGALADRPYLLTGNLPYNLTTPLLFKALEPPLPERAVFLVQREVAERLTASAGAHAYGALTVNVQIVTEAEIVAHVPAGAFHPRPGVDSAVIRLTPRVTMGLDLKELAPFRRFVQAMFGMRRKQLRRALREVDGLLPDEAAAILSRCGIPATERPENVSPDQFVALFRSRGESFPSGDHP